MLTCVVDALCRFRPRILIDVTKVDLSTNVLGFNISMPIMVAPTAMQRMAHPEGELATARAVAKHGTIMVYLPNKPILLLLFSSNLSRGLCLLNFSFLRCRLCHRGPLAAWRRLHPSDPASVSSSSTCTRTGTSSPSWCVVRRGQVSRPSPSQSTLLVLDVVSRTSRTGITEFSPSLQLFSNFEVKNHTKLRLKFSSFLWLCLVVMQVCFAEAPDLG